MYLPKEIKMNDTQVPISTIKIYNNYIKFISSTNEIKKVQLFEESSVTFETNRPSNVELKINKGEEGELSLPASVSIKIVSQNEDGLKYQIDDDLKDIVNVVAKPPKDDNKLSGGAIAGIVVGSVAVAAAGIGVVIRALA